MYSHCTIDSSETSEAGLSMLELLVSIVILGIVAFNVASATMTSLKTYKRTMRNGIAAELAVDKLESFAAKDPASLSDQDDETELSISIDGVRYSRTTDVTINSDQSRTVVVEVLPHREALGGSALFSSTFSLRGSQ